MNTIYFFRGQSATGKTLLTDKLSKDKNIAIIRKDDIFDMIHNYIDDHKIINLCTYEVIANIIQTQVNNKCDCIIDVGLPDKTNYFNFIKKINLENCKLISFLCTCSNQEIWRDRINQRLKNPLSHQSYKSFEDLLQHYKKCDLTPIENENILDSCNDVNIILQKINVIIS